MFTDFYKNKPNNKIWWIVNMDTVGEFLFSFDKKTIFNLFRDFHKLTPEQKLIFREEEPTLAKLVDDRW